MKRYCFVVFCFIVQIYGMEQSIENWSNSPIVREGFEQFLGSVYSYESQPLVGGLLSEAPCVCTVNDNKYVARIFKGLPDNRQTKVAINCLVADKGIAPKIYYHDHHDDFSFVIMDFVNTHTLFFEQAHDHLILDLVAQKVKLIEQFDVNMVTANKETLFDETMRHYESIKKKHTASHVNVILEELKYKTEILYQKIKNQGRPLVINHNDLHPRNMFFINNDLVIIDWETIALSYKFGDLALYSILSSLNKKDDLYLLTRYLECIPSADDEQYFKMVKLMGRIGVVLSCFDFIEAIPESTEVIREFRQYAMAFAHDTSADSSKFFYEFGMSQLQEFREEFEKFEYELI